MVKMGGHALDELQPTAPALVALAADIETLQRNGDQVVVVHGGGPQINELLNAVSIDSRFVDGLRVTDERTMHYVDLALAGVNRALVAALHVAGANAVGLSGFDGGLLRARSIGEPWGHVAATPQVDGSVLTTLLAAGFVPVVSPVASDDEGSALNCNADTAAGAIAGALDATGLVLLSDIDQLRADPDDASSGLTNVSIAEVEAMIASGAAREGMRPKLAAAAQALEAGAQRVWLANGTRPHALRDVLQGNLATTEVSR